MLLPLSALCREGHGALGDAALRFIDWLADGAFSVWQVLPLVPVGQDGSPYWSRADRAGEPALIDRAAPDPGNDADFAASIADSILCLRQGQIIHQGPGSDAANPEILKKVFGTDFIRTENGRILQNYGTPHNP